MTGPASKFRETYQHCSRPCPNDIPWLGQQYWCHRTIQKISISFQGFPQNSEYGSPTILREKTSREGDLTEIPESSLGGANSLNSKSMGALPAVRVFTSNR
jgi:hypothetical protein